MFYIFGSKGFIGLVVTLTLTVIISIFAENHPLKELSATMLYIYKDPKEGSSERLLDAAKDYLNQLVKLKMDVRVNKTGSLEELRDIYLEGNPPYHLRNIPWDKLIEQYNWKDVEMTDYHDVIQDTRRIWSECLHELEKFKEPDEII